MSLLSMQIELKKQIIRDINDDIRNIVLNKYNKLITIPSKSIKVENLYSINTDETMKEFVKQNEDLITLKNELKDYRLNYDNFLNKINNKDVKNTYKILFDATTYVTYDIFNSKIKTLCNMINNNKTLNDIYILVLPEDPIGFVWEKSNLWVSLLSILNDLKIDAFLDLSNYKKTMGDENNIKYARELLFDKILIDKDLTNKKINFIICDDCVYSGNQIKNIFNTIINIINKAYKTHKTNIKYKIIPLIPYILSDDTFKMINADIFNISTDMIEFIDTTRKEIKTINTVLNNPDTNFFTTHLINQYIDSNNYHNNLIYFQFKSADNLSVPTWLYSGNLEIAKKHDDTINVSETYVSVKNNCPNIKDDCPTGLYKNLKYTYNGKPFYNLIEDNYKHYYDLPTTLCLLAGDTNNRVKELKI